MSPAAPFAEFLRVPLAAAGVSRASPVLSSERTVNGCRLPASALARGQLSPVAPERRKRVQGR